MFLARSARLHLALSRLDPRKRRLCKEKKATLLDRLFVVRETGLEPVWINHTPLKRARLPVPPLSRGRLPLYRKHTALSRKISLFSQLFCEIPPAGGTRTLAHGRFGSRFRASGTMPHDGARTNKREKAGRKAGDKAAEPICKVPPLSPVEGRRVSVGAQVLEVPLTEHLIDCHRHAV